MYFVFFMFLAISSVGLSFEAVNGRLNMSTTWSQVSKLQWFYAAIGMSFFVYIAFVIFQIINK